LLFFFSSSVFFRALFLFLPLFVFLLIHSWLQQQQQLFSCLLPSHFPETNLKSLDTTGSNDFHVPYGHICFKDDHTDRTESQDVQCELHKSVKLN
jgi:hypothetical protein